MTDRNTVGMNFSLFLACKRCGLPMIGILQASAPSAPRIVCKPCGGSPIEDENHTLDVPPPVV
ncbi:MAG: hypothetical protein WC130_03820 [Kiritimatiellia bacterium]